MDMISDTSRYMLLIVGLYQRNLPFFLDLLESESCVNNLLIWNMAF